MLFDEVLEEPMLHEEELAAAVGALTETDDSSTPHQLIDAPEVVAVASRRARRERDGALLKPCDCFVGSGDR
jgi:hypothetical protein